MKNKILLAVLSLAMTTSFTSLCASIGINAADPSVRLMGRMAEKNGSVTMGFPGIEMELRFSGSSDVKMSGEVLSGQGWFNVYIDGKALPVLEIPTGKYTVTLADKLDPKQEHLLRMVRRNEAWQGVVRVDGFSVDDGAKILSPDPLPTRKIMAIGDSITCGQNTELIPPATPGNHCANAELAYGWLLAKDFNAQINLVSYGGKGLVRDWHGVNTQMLKDIAAEGTVSNPKEVVSIPDIFERALPDDPTSVWDHASYQPDLILICLGQNDFSHVSLPLSDYAQAYIKFVDRVHAVYPNARIIVMSSPMAEMTRDDGWQPRGKALEMAISIMDMHYIKQGDPVVMPIFMNHQPGTAIDSHPIAPQHRAMADELKPIIKFLTGWTEAK
jgi:lysophospholipase L1-like esterase